MRALTLLSLLSLVACKGGGEDTGPIDDADGDGYGASEDCDDDNAAVSPGADEIPYDGVDNDCSAETPDNDLDGDGYLAADDCDDQDSAVNPGATEVCDEIDNDCDGNIDGEGAEGSATWYADLDQDGYGDDGTTTVGCDQPSLYVSVGGDCDDGDAGIYPDAPETCDEVDQDCDDEIDEGATDGTVHYYDGDLDGYGDDKDTDTFCEGSSSPVWTTVSGDCDGDDYYVNPGAIEVCDGVDNDCNDEIDDDPADGVAYYTDADADGFGDADAKEGTIACEEISGTASNKLDCDDGDKSVNPFAEDVCGDGVDNDCDGVEYDGETWYADADGDGYGADDDTLVQCDEPTGYLADAGDCDDLDVDVNPDAEEICADGVDNDCDGSAPSCTLEGEQGLSSAISVSSSSTNHGWSFTTVDFDDDGQEDLVTSSDASSSEGDVWLYTGPITASITDADAFGTLQGDFGDGAGGIVVNVGDVDGDRIDDVLVNAVNSDASYTDSGAAYLLLGGVTGSGSLSDGYTITADGEIDPVNAPSYLGWAMAAAGDVDGDRTGDFWIGAIGENEGYDIKDASDVGFVYLMTGPITGDVSVADAQATLSGEADYDYLGREISSGDFDGDGTPDVAVSTYNTWEVYLHHGLVTGAVTMSDLDVQLTSSATGSFGYSINAESDFNDDGYGDVLVGDIDTSINATNDGGVYVFHGPITGNLTEADAAATIGGVTDAQYIGEVVSYVGDLDYDGVDDLGIGNSYNSGYASGGGTVFVFQGPVTGSMTTDDAWAAVHGETSTEYVGWPKTGRADDLTGDGYADLLVGAPYISGAVYVVPSHGNEGF